MTRTIIPKKPTALTILTLVVAFTGFSLVTHPKHSSAATGCTALSTTKGAVTVSSVSVPSTTTYHVWSRIKAPDTTNNSFLFQTDNNCNITIGNATSIPANTWTWVDYKNGSTTTKADISLSAGTHPMELAGSEDGVQVDRILLLSDTCVPTGTGDNCVVAPDTTPPTVSLAAPTNGATVSGSNVTVSANASDDTGVVGVQFKLDGANLNTEDTSSPYSITWNTTSVANGTHTLTAVARDAAGNSTTSSSVTVTVNNATSSCSTSSTTWQNTSIATQTGNFTFDFDATPQANNIDSVVGNSNGAAASYNDIATTIRFNSSGTIDARNAGAYTSDVSVPYSAGTSYHFKFTINTAAHTYSVVVTPSGGSAINLATNYGFRTSVATVSSLNNWALFQDPTSAGSQQVCNATVAATTTTKPGDFNNDGVVNIFDLSIMLTNYGKSTAQSSNPACDMNSDGTINIFDLSSFLSKYGT